MAASSNEGHPTQALETLCSDLPISKALDSKDVQDKLAGVGCEPYKGTAEQFAALVREDLPKWARIVKDSGATVD